MDKPKATSNRGHTAGDCDRSGQSGAHLTLNRRTMTEINDHLKLLICARGHPRIAALRPAGAARPAIEASAENSRRRAAAAGDPRLVICFPVSVPERMSVGRSARGARSPGLFRAFTARRPAGSRWCRIGCAPATAAVGGCRKRWRPRCAPATGGSACTRKRPGRCGAIPATCTAPIAT